MVVDMVKRVRSDKNSEEGRPSRLKGHADISQIRTSCLKCQDGDHKGCNGWSTRNKVECLCAWLKHQDI